MKHKNPVLRGAAALCLSAIVLALAACGKEQGSQQAAAAAVPVGVVTLKTQPVTLSTELPGRTDAVRTAEVRPQVNGIILKRLFTEGGEVKAGQQLYQIDPALYEASVASSKASLASAEAQVRTANALVERYKPLVSSRAISRQTYDDAVATRDQARASVLSAKAALDTANINLTYTKVLSPIDGIIGRSSVTEGALVTASQSTAMATIQQVDPIYVDVTQSSTQLLRLKKALASGEIKRSEDGEGAEVSLTLEDGTPYAHKGKLEFSEVTVDQTTGSVTLRALFPNPDHLLLPGMFVRASLAEGVAPQALLVPQRGVTRNQRGEPTALVVGADNKVEQRTLKTDRTVGDHWLVTDGLKAGDKVIVEGIQKAQVGAEVAPTEWQPAAGQPGAADASQAAQTK